MIYPTLKVEVWKRQGTDVFAQAIMVRSPDEKVCPVRLSFISDNTTVRTDSAGSKGHAQEENAKVVILAVPKTRIEIEDRLYIHGHGLRVTQKHPRYTVGGVLDHYEVHCALWA